MKEKEAIILYDVGEAAAEKERDLSGTGVRKLAAAGGMNGDYKVGVVIDNIQLLADRSSECIINNIPRGNPGEAAHFKTEVYSQDLGVCGCAAPPVDRYKSSARPIVSAIDR